MSKRTTKRVSKRIRMIGRGRTRRTGALPEEGRAMENGLAGEEAVGVDVLVEPVSSRVDAEAPPERGRGADAAPERRGLVVRRRFTEPGLDPYATVEWERRSAVIYGEKGEVVFEQHDVEVPKTWTQLATNVVVSKYFRGPLGTPQRERSVRQLIGRVVGTIRSWGVQQG